MSDWRIVYEEPDGSPSQFFGLFYGDGHWVGGRYGGSVTMLHTTDPEGTWTVYDWPGVPDDTASLPTMRYGNGYFVSVDQAYFQPQTATDPTGSWTVNSDISDVGSVTFVNGTWLATTVMASTSSIYHATDPAGSWSEMTNVSDVIDYAISWDNSPNHSLYYLNGQWVAMFYEGAIALKSYILTASTIDGAWTLQWESDADDTRGAGRLFYDSANAKYHLFWLGKVHESNALDGTWTEVVDFAVDYSATGSVNKMNEGLGLFFASGDYGRVLTASDIDGPYEGEEMESNVGSPVSSGVVASDDDALAWDASRLWIRADGGEGWGVLCS